MKKVTFFIVLSMFVVSCNSDDDNLFLTAVEFSSIAEGNLLGNGSEGFNKQNMVISSSIAWNNLISPMNSVNNVSDNFTETNIDFSQYKVIAIFDAIRGTSGHSLDLRIMSNSNIIIVKISNVRPEEVNIPSISQPFHIVKILKSDLPITFE